MSIVTKQNADGTASLVDVTDGFKEMIRTGGAGSATRYRGLTVAVVDLAAVDTAGGVFNWLNDTGDDVLVRHVVLDVVTASSGACTVDIGETVTSAVTLSDNLIDGISVATIGVFDNTIDIGTNGKGAQKVLAGDWVTGSVASGASAALVGTVNIEYQVI